MIENVDRRVLGGFSFADAITGNSLPGPFVVNSPGWSLKPNRNGVYAIFDGPNFDALTTQFVPSGTWPTAVTFELTIADPSLSYLPRRASISAPQPLASLAQPQRISLYPAVSFPVAPGWAVVRASVVNAASSAAGLPWAVVQIVRTSDSKQIAVGVADSRGEALLAVLGLTWQTGASSSGPVTETTLAVSIEAFFDPSNLAQPTGWIPNPDDILGNLTNAVLKTATVTAALAPGQTFNAPLAISV